MAFHTKVVGLKVSDLFAKAVSASIKDALQALWQLVAEPIHVEAGIDMLAYMPRKRLQRARPSWRCAVRWSLLCDTSAHLHPLGFQNMIRLQQA